MATGNQGLGSDNMSDAKKKEIQKKGGQASHGTSNTSGTSSRSTTTNRGSNLTDADRAKGGHNSHSGTGS